MKAIKAFFRRLFGYNYLLNKSTGEVHLVANEKYQCGISRMGAKNKKFITKKKFNKIKFKYIDHKYINGCRFCNKTQDRG